MTQVATTALPAFLPFHLMELPPTLRNLQLANDVVFNADDKDEDDDVGLGNDDDFEDYDDDLGEDYDEEDDEDEPYYGDDHDFFEDNDE